jgi:phosphatidate cytidylyltransferase
LIFAAVMLLGVLWNQWSFLVLVSIIHFGCWWEYLTLIEKIQNTRFHLYTRLGFMIMGYALMLWFCKGNWNINGYELSSNISLPVSAAGFAVLLMGIFQKNPVNPKAILVSVFGLAYISLVLGLFLETRMFENPGIPMVFGSIIVVTTIASIWINDTMAYIVGSFIGKTPLSRISPKKTWEGTVGGILLSGALMWVVAELTGFGNRYGLGAFDFAILAASASIAGTIGDLFESKLKRMAGVKDSGSLMPGHGGFLDRFDSLLFAIPVAWVLFLPCGFGQC